MTHAEINLSNLKNNYRIIKQITSVNTDVICVVKAEAYGHGFVRCSETLYDEGARFFAVANAAEALELRHIMRDAEIIILGYTPHEMYETLIENNIIQTVYNLDRINKNLRVHIKVDTGMNRLGFEWDYNNFEDFKFLNIEGIYTHLACADDTANNMTLDQLERFNYFIKRSGLKNKMLHAANSAALINFPESHFDAVRIGALLYGLQAAQTIPNGIKPVMTLKTIVTHVHTVKKGETVGYGAAYTAERDMKVVTLPIGYADGFIRAYNKSYVTLAKNKQPLPIIGRICMDQCMADATNINEPIKIGDEIVIFGENALCTAEDFSAWGSTINYETVCLISKRVPRIYLL